MGGITFIEKEEQELALYGEVEGAMIFVFGLRNEDVSVEDAWQAALKMRDLMAANSAGLLVDIGTATVRALDQVQEKLK